MKDHKIKCSAAAFLLCSGIMVIYWSESRSIRHNNQKHLSEKISDGSRIRLRNKSRLEIQQKSSVFPQRLAQVASLPESEREAELVKVLESAINDDPQFVANNLMDLNIAYSIKCAIAKQLLRSWPDHKRSLAWAQANFNGLDRGRYLGLALGVHAVTSPAEALIVSRSLGGSERVLKDAFSGLVDGWFVGDRSSLLGYVQQANQSGQAGEIVDQISLAWVTSDLPGAINYLENSSGEGYLKTLARMTAAVSMIEKSPSEVFVWAESLEGPSGADARIAVIETWAEKAPRDVAVFLETVEPHIKVEFGPALVAKWAVSDPLAATRWIDQIPESPSKGRIVSKAMECLVTANTIHASEWLKSLPEGDSRDAGILVLLDQEGRKDPQGVFPWADALSSEVLKEREINRLMGILERQTSQP
jgi:hypothetical protein